MSHRTLFYYDQESNVTCVRDADNGLTYFTYDLLNRMTSVKNPFGEVTYYDYSPGGQVKRRTLGNQTLTYYEYDDVGRVSKVDNRKSDLSVLSTFEYEHDKVGNPTKITREDGSATYYQYDRIYQLTGETQVDGQGQVEYAFEYQYDKAHNRTVKVDNGTATYYTHNEANELLTETTNGQTTYYQYDRCGNTVAKQEPSGTTYYQYDTENLMTRIDFADGSHNYFGYDADSKRVSARTSEAFTEFIYQGPDMLELLLERDDQGTTQAHYTMGDGLEAMRRANGDGIASGNSSFYHYNHLGTTHELTDADQDVTDTYRHDAWGVPLGRTGTTVNPHTYVGRDRYYWNAQAQLHQLGLRAYAARIARFVTVDPLGTSSRRIPRRVGTRVGSASRAAAGVRARLRYSSPPRHIEFASLPAYLYAANSPVSRSDPSGLIDPLTCAILALLGLCSAFFLCGCGDERCEEEGDPKGRLIAQIEGLASGAGAVVDTVGLKQLVDMVCPGGLTLVHRIILKRIQQEEEAGDPDWVLIDKLHELRAYVEAKQRLCR